MGAVAFAAALIFLERTRPVESSAIQLSSTAYIATQADRQFLKYVIRCALPQGVVVESKSRYGHFRFNGRHGLAPDWTKRPLIEQEQELVSACILALTNKFGVAVPVYLVPGTKPPNLKRRKEDGSLDYRLFEGAFFGNLFLPSPKAFVCVGNGRTVAPGDPIWSKRVCGLPDGNGGRTSRCGMVIVGSCGTKKPYTVSGVTWSNPIQVYLRPQGRSDLDLK